MFIDTSTQVTYSHARPRFDRQWLPLLVQEYLNILTHAKLVVISNRAKNNSYLKGIFET